MSIPVKATCPLGNTCEEIRDGAINRCAWYMSVKGQDPQTGDTIDRWDCALVWQVVVSIEQSQQIRGVQAATESFRNEMVTGQHASLTALLSAAHERRLT